MAFGSVSLSKGQRESRWRLLLLVNNHPWRSAKKTADRYRAFPSSFEEGIKGWWQTLSPASEKEESGRV